MPSRRAEHARDTMQHLRTYIVQRFGVSSTEKKQIKDKARECWLEYGVALRGFAGCMRT